MKLFQRLVFAAVLAGLAAGLCMSALQQWKLVPLIIAAESYEAAAADNHAPASAAAPWAPQAGLERTSYTVLANLLAAIGFALLLSAAALITGVDLSARTGLIWGAAGFAAFQLAPALGLPPELPAMAAAELGSRQVWWWATVLSTGAGLLALARLRNSVGAAVAVLLLLAPQIIAAPLPTHLSSGLVPAELASAFAASSLAVGAAFWLLLGALLGWLSDRFTAAEAAAVAKAPA